MSDRVERIRRRLETALHPARLEIVDEGHKHVGHPGARDGRGHFHVTVVSDAFRALPRLGRHRLVYQALGEMMSTDIHALSIDARTEEE